MQIDSQRKKPSFKIRKDQMRIDCELAKPLAMKKHIDNKQGNNKAGKSPNTI